MAIVTGGCGGHSGPLAAMMAMVMAATPITMITAGTAATAVATNSLTQDTAGSVTLLREGLPTSVGRSGALRWFRSSLTRREPVHPCRHCRVAKPRY